MRVLIVLFGLVATPFLVGVSQGQSGLPGRGHDDAHCAQRLAQHPGKDINKCDPPVTQPPVTQPPVTQPPVTQPPVTQPPVTQPPPPPASSCVSSGPGAGTGTVQGQVFVDDPAQNYPYLAGWCVEVRDFNGAVIATAVTSGVALDLEGNNYVLTGVPAGTYTVCEVLPPSTTWRETAPTSGPACGGGVIGITALVTDRSVADFLWFGNLP